MQIQRHLGILWLLDFDEQIECLFRIIFGLGLPNVVDRGLGFWL
ncbi:MAG: hypothetical protein ACJAVT_002785 [Yoonia sp.]